MRIKTCAALGVAFAMAAMLAGPAAAGVTGCKASGGKQEGGAVIGAVVGGLIGNRVASHERGLGTVAGAAAGAAAGSAIGCEMQKKDAREAGSDRARRGYAVGERMPAAYIRDGRNRVEEPWRYRLRPAPTGYRWVAMQSDAYLVRTSTGLVREVAPAALDN
jgi:uncharacterized protein YcfJ